MATNRTPINRATKAKITPQMVALYHLLSEIFDDDDHRTWEEDGGRRREFLGANSLLDALAHRAPWQTSVIDAIFHCPDGPPAWERNTAERDWAGARSIATALEEAAREDA